MIRECKKHGITEHAPRKKGEKIIGWRCKKCTVEAVTEWRRRTKSKSVEYLGGKCKYCGYDKYHGAMEFHHPGDDKDFGLSQSGVTRSWHSIMVELDKCELVCKNCHAEIHGCVVEDAGSGISTATRDIIKKPRPDKFCVDRGIKIDKSAKSRCVKCGAINSRKVKDRPPKEQLLKEISESSYLAVGRKYGVSDNSIRKWIK